ILIGWAMVGLVLLAREVVARRSSGLGPILAIVWPVAFFLSLTRWVEVNTAADQWRLLFPAYPALAGLLVAGWRRLLRTAWQLIAAIPAGLLALNVGLLALVSGPAYRGPLTYEGEVPHPREVRFGDALELVGYSTARPLNMAFDDPVE